MSEPAIPNKRHFDAWRSPPIPAEIVRVSVLRDLLPAKADRNKCAFTVINPGSTSDVINKLTVLLYRFKPGQRLLIGPFGDLAAGVHTAPKLLQ